MNQSLQSINIISDIDNVVFEVACEQAIFFGYSLIYISDILPKLKVLSIPVDDVFASLGHLCEKGFIVKKMAYLNDKELLVLFSISHDAFDAYLKKHYKNYSLIHKLLLYVIRNEEISNLKSEKISEVLRIPKMIINHFLEILQQEGIVKLTKTVRGNWFVDEVIS